MSVTEIATNGSFITSEILDAFAALKLRPLVKVGFDGLSHHDWFRGEKGVEERTLTAIRLLLERGFCVRVQMNFHKGNLATILPSLRYLDKMGVHELRLIRTSESPRWDENGKGLCIPLEEFYPTALDFARDYLLTRPAMQLDIWQVVRLYPRGRAFSLSPVWGGQQCFKDSVPTCKSTRGLIAVTPSGELVPCLQISGHAKKLGHTFGNVHTAPLRKFLQDSVYLDTVTTTVAQRGAENPKCQSCAFWKLCTGGCPAFASRLKGSLTAYDPIKCMFFYGGYMEKFLRMFDEVQRETGDAYRCLSDIPLPDKAETAPV
jgi:radical SAM protein with 4Fe4S-binding SPASM domain